MHPTRGHLPMGSQRRHGFTLIEVLIVVAIIGIGAALAIFSLQKTREAVSLDRATAQVRSAIEEARELAALAGSRIGTPRLVDDGTCGGGTANQMEVTIDGTAGTVIFPSQVTFDGEIMTKSCETWTLADVVAAGSTAGFVAPAGLIRFSFAPSGRLIAPGPVFVRIASPGDPENSGFRVLMSGVMCQASDPAPPPGRECDDSPNW